MALIISPGYVLGVTPDENNPHIGYQTWVRDRNPSDVLVSTESAEGPKDSILRPDTHEFWQPTVHPATIRIDLGQARSVDYVGIAGHNIGTSSRRNFLSLPGTAGDFASSPDAAPLDIVGDIDLRGEVAPDDWTPGIDGTVVSKFLIAGSQRAYRLILKGSGELRMSWSEDGTIVTTKDSTVVTGFVDGTRHFVRATLDVDNGAAGNDVKFYTSEDGFDWTQLGATVTTAAVTSIFNSTAQVEIGSREIGTLNLLKGKIYTIQILNGINGDFVFNAIFKNELAGTLSFFESSNNGAAVTINQSGSPEAEIKAVAATSILVEYSTDDAIWTTFASAIAPVTDAPIMFLDTSIPRRYWRITVTGDGDLAKIAVINIGEVLLVQRSIYGGHPPAVLNRDTEMFQNLSDGGQFLGQYVKRRGVNGSVNLRHLEPGWYRANFDTFVKAAQEFPYFFAWRPVDFPLEVVFAWTKNDIRPSNMSIRGLMQVDFGFKGIGNVD